MTSNGKKINNTALRVTVWGVGIVTVLIAGSYVFLILWKKNWSVPLFLDALYNAITRNPGDLSWGTIGVLLTVESFLLMLMTFRTQRRQFEDQYTTENASRFENTFFNLLSMFQNVREMTNDDIRAREHKETTQDCGNLEDVSIKFLDSVRNDASMEYAVKAFQKEDGITDQELKDIRTDYGAKFSEFLRESGFSLSYYYRYLSNIIDYVIDYWKDDEETIKKYLNFIQAQMSDAELSLLFYNCLSKQSKDSDHHYSFRDKLNRYNFLQNLNEDSLVQRSHHVFYETTIFRFLKNKEKELKIEKRNEMYGHSENLQ